MKIVEQTLWARANTAFRNRDFESAVALYEEALRQAEDPLKPYIYLSLQLSRSRLGQSPVTACIASPKIKQDRSLNFKATVNNLVADQCPLGRAFRIELADFVDIDQYVAASADLVDAASRGILNARTHLVECGFDEIYHGTRKLTKGAAYQGEATYLSRHPEIANQVRTGQLSCGLEHYIRFGLTMSDPILIERFKMLHPEFALTVVSLGSHQSQKTIEHVLSSDRLRIVTLANLITGQAQVLKGSWIALVHAGVVLDPGGLYAMAAMFDFKSSPSVVFGGVRLHDGTVWMPGMATSFDKAAAVAWPAIFVTPNGLSEFHAALGVFDTPGSSRDRLKFFINRLMEQRLELVAHNAKPLTGFATREDERSFYAGQTLIEMDGECDEHCKEPAVSIIIPFRDKVELLCCCVDSILSNSEYINYEIILVDNDSVEPKTLTFLKDIEKSSDKVRVLRYHHPFNFSAICNFAARHSDADVLLFLNNDTEIFSTDWLNRMSVLAMRYDVGAVGALLTYEGDEIQHAGIAIGLNGLAGLAYAGTSFSELIFNWKFLITHPVEAVTGACLAIERTKFEQIGGMDEINLSVALNDIDLCLRLAEQGMTNLLVPHLTIRHYESQSREWDCYDSTGRFAKEVAYFRERHRAALQRGDRFIDLNCLESLKVRAGNIQGRVILILAIRLSMGFGVDLVIHEQARRLLRNGAMVIVGVHEHDRDYYGDVPYKVIVINRSERKVIADDISSIITNNKVDIVIAHTTPFFEVLPSLQGRVKTVVYEHGDPSPELFPKDRSERQTIKDWKVAHVYPRVDKVIAISHFISEDINWPQAEIIYNGVDHLSTKVDASNLANFRLRFGLNDPQKKIFLCVARLGKGERNYKGFDEFIAFRQFYSQDDAVFMVVGRGTEEDARELRDVGIQVLINATESDLRCAYKACDAFFSFSRWEGFNLPLVEAQSFGKPAFAIDRCSHREVTNNVFASFKEIAQFVERKSKEELAELGSSSAKYIEQFTWNKNVHSLVKSLSRIIGQCRDSRPIVPGRVSICIVSKNKLGYIKPCIESLVSLKKTNDIEILLGDTGSNDQEVLSFYETIAHDVQIHYYNFYNFSKINNYLAQSANGDVLVFLNNDTLVIDSDFLKTLRELLSYDSVGVVGPMLLYGDGSIQHAGVEIFLEEPFRYVGWHPYAKRQPQDLVPVTGVYSVPAVTGACLAIKTELFREVGGFEEVYREECQDVDLCLKVRMLGKKILYTGKTSLFHYENGTREISESLLDRREFRSRWGDCLDLLFLKNPKQRIPFEKSVKIEWCSKKEDELLRYLREFNDCEVTIVLEGIDLPDKIKEHVREDRVRVLPHSCPDNYQYDQNIIC